MRVTHSEIPHPWRTSWAVFTLSVYLFLGLYWLLTEAVPWLTDWHVSPWSWGPIQG